MTAPAPRAASGPLCMATTPALAPGHAWMCNAAAGHPAGTDHAAYGSHGRPSYTWAQRAPAPRREAALTGLADWIEHQLSDELASRQHIAEAALARIRQLAASPGSAPSSAATGVLPDGSAVLSPADLLMVLGALSDGAERREHRGQPDLAAAYRAVAWRLGDDRA